MDTANLSAHAQYEVVCKAGEAKPKPVFSWTLDGKPLTGLETRDEEVMVDADGLSKFSQSLIYSPYLWHNNKTLACSIAHPGLPDDLKASTRILLALPPSVRAASFPVSGIIGIAVFTLLLTAIVVSLVVFKCRKARGLAEGKTDPEKAESNETGLDKGSKTESATEEEEEEEVVKPNVQKKITAFFSSLKTKDQKKGVDDTLATEWEKVSLVDEKEKKAEEEMKKEKAGLASKVTALLTKLRPEKKEEEVKVEEVKEEEKKVEEEKEEKPSTEEKPVRRGS